MHTQITLFVSSGNTSSEVAALAAAQEILDPTVVDILLLLWLQEKRLPAFDPLTAYDGFELGFPPGPACNMPGRLRDWLNSAALASDARFWQRWNMAESDLVKDALLYERVVRPSMDTLLTSPLFSNMETEAWIQWCTAKISIAITTNSPTSWDWSVTTYVSVVGPE